jgi:hypothetical protein
MRVIRSVEFCQSFSHCTDSIPDPSIRTCPHPPPRLQRLFRTSTHTYIMIWFPSGRLETLKISRTNCDQIRRNVVAIQSKFCLNFVLGIASSQRESACGKGRQLLQIAFSSGQAVRKVRFQMSRLHRISRFRCVHIPLTSFIFL